MRIKSFVVAALAAVPFAAHAQDTLSLLGRNALTFGVGISGSTSSTVTPDGVSSHASGQVTTLQFSHWMRPIVAFQVSAGVLGENTTTSPGHVHNNTLTPILVGLSLSPRSFAVSRKVRPYLSAAVGPYIHSVSDLDRGSVSNTVESALGARFGVGVNWFLTRHFLLGAEGDYHAVGDFDHPDALTREPSGFGVSLLIGIAWGGR